MLCNCYFTSQSNNTTKDSFWVGKFDTTGDLLWNYRYIAPVGNTIQVAPRTTIDIFGDRTLLILELMIQQDIELLILSRLVMTVR